jgi:dihydrofolate reductase
MEERMGIVQVTLSMSVDGYITGPDPTEELPLGTAADVIAPGGERWMVDEIHAGAGAVVAGRRVYDHVNGWGEEPPFRMPVFVPTHRPHDVRVAGATTFTFVRDVESAIAQAKAAAGDKNVYLMGGANTVDQALRLGLVDELNLHIEPALLGGGARLFADVGSDRIRLERTRLIEGPATTHVQFRVLR